MSESSKIKAADIAEKDLFKNTQESADKFAESLKVLEKTLKDLTTSFVTVLQVQEKVLKQNTKDAKDIKDKTAALSKSQSARLGLIAVEKEEIKLKVEQNKLNKQLAQIQKANNKDADIAAKLAAKEADARKKLNSAYSQASAKLNEMRKRYKDLAVQEKENTTTGRLLKEEITKLDKKLKDVDASVGQFQRSVGDYKNQMKDAIKETFAFGGGLGVVTAGFQKVYEAELLATAGANKFSAALKATGIGLVIGAALLLKEAFDASQTAIDEAAIAAAKAKDVLLNTGVTFENVARLTIAWRDDLRSLQEQLQSLTLDQEDFNEISDDTTIGFETRNKALAESIRLGKEAVEVEVKIAEGKLRLAEAELKAATANALGTKALDEATQKRFEAEEQLKVILDKKNDLARINDKELRQRNLEQASFEIDLLLKKKQSANAEKVILEGKLADEKFQLEERVKFANKLLEVNRATTAEEIKIFKEKTGILFDENEFLNEQDAIALQRKLEGIQQTFINQNGVIEGTKLGAEAVVILAKITKSFQENEIENAKTLADLADEKIARLRIIAEIEREIDDLNQQQSIKLLEDGNDAKVQASDKANEEILEGENVLNVALSNLRKIKFEETVASEKEITAEKEKQLKDRADNEKILLKTTIKDDEIRAEEIKKIEEQLRIDIENLYIQSKINLKELDEKEIEELKKIAQRKKDIADGTAKANDEAAKKAADKRKKETNDTITQIQNITKALQDEVDKKNQIRLDEAEREIDLRETNIDRQTKLAEDGQVNQLAFEEAQLQKSILAKKELEEKAARQKEILDTIESYQAFLLARLNAENADPNTAPFLALKDTLLSRGVAKGLVQFAADGNDMIEGEGTTTSDSIPFMLSKKEAVIKASENIKHNDAVIALNAGKFDEQFMPRFELQNVHNYKDNSLSNGAILNALNDVKNEIKNKPVQTWEVNAINELVEKRITADMTKKIVYKTKYKFH